MCEPCGRASVCSTSRIARLYPDYDPDLVEYARSSPVGGFAHSHVSSKNRFVYVPHLIELEEEVARVENGRGGAIRLREWKEARAASLAQAELDANAIRDALHDLTKTPAGAKAKDQTRRDHECVLRRRATLTAQNPPAPHGRGLHARGRRSCERPRTGYAGWDAEQEDLRRCSCVVDRARLR